MSTLAKVGFVELAVGALSGWVVVVSREWPDVLKRAGVRVPRRLLQAHLDLILMGLILIAVGLALPELPDAIAIALAFGTWSTRCCSSRSRSRPTSTSGSRTARSAPCRSSASAAA